jgi:predicted DNA-binding transcriptional regulator AlpA
MTQPDVAAALGIPVLQLWTVSGNPQFPRPISNDGAGNVVWNSAVIAAFVVLRNAAKANGWKIYPAALPTLNLAFMAANAPGPGYVP